MEKIKGRVWVFGDNVDTDQILPGYAMVEDYDKLGNYALAGSPVPDFAKQVKNGDIIIGGKNFGCGSSREQAPVALKQAGVSLVVAESFARIFRRNSINIGLPVLMADLTGQIKTGDVIEADLAEGMVVLNGKKSKGMPLSENVLAIIKAGGLINRVREELGVTKGR